MGARQSITGFVARHEVSWELSFGLLAAVFVALAFVEPSEPGAEAAIVGLEWALTGIFAAEFVVRLWAAPDRRSHLRGHVIDLVSVIPPARWLRPFRLLRLLRLVRTFAGVSRAIARVPRMANHKGLVWMFAGWLAVMLLSSFALFMAEHDVNSAVASPLDALWWGITTMTTVGYGDVYPKTAEGRMAAVVLMVLGIGLYSAIIAALTSYFVGADAGTSLSDELERLDRLHASGGLTVDEYAAAKARVIRG